MFHWWYIPLIIVIMPILLIVIWALSMRRSMPWQNILAITSNLHIPLCAWLRRIALSGERDYSTLPDPLVMSNGIRIDSVEQFEKHRAEILTLFEENVYGTLPKDGFRTTFETVEQGDAMDGKALRKQIKITVSTEKGSSEAMMLLYAPRHAVKAPVIIGLNFRGNHTALDDPEILPSYTTDTADGTWVEKRGSAVARWNITDSIARGYAVATISASDFAPDGKDTYASRVIALFDEPEFKAVGAWAFGLIRGIDVLTQEEELDIRHIAVIGHSRLGKAALWATANDLRIGMVISNDSGNSGASLSRGNHGESITSINQGFPHWFCSKYKEYAGRENELPVDQNLLLASLAPRKLYVANAESDLWADPQGAFNAVQSAKKAYALYYGDAVPPDGEDAYSTVNIPVFSESIGMHVRTGWHDVQKEDWAFYLDYMDRYYLAKEPSAASLK